MRVAAGALEQVPGLPLDPGRFDARALHAPDLAAEIEDLRDEQPRRRLLCQRRTRENPELALARAAIDPLLVLARDIGGQAGEEGQVDGLIKRGSRYQG